MGSADRLVPRSGCTWKTFSSRSTCYRSGVTMATARNYVTGAARSRWKTSWLHLPHKCPDGHSEFITLLYLLEKSRKKYKKGCKKAVIESRKVIIYPNNSGAAGLYLLHLKSHLCLNMFQNIWWQFKEHACLSRPITFAQKVWSKWIFFHPARNMTFMF